MHFIDSKWPRYLEKQCHFTLLSMTAIEKLFDRAFYENRQCHLASATILNTFFELRRPLETSLSKQTIAMQIPKGSDDITSHSLTCQDCWLQKPQLQLNSRIYVAKNWIDSHNVFVYIVTMGLIICFQYRFIIKIINIISKLYF